MHNKQALHDERNILLEYNNDEHSVLIKHK